MGIKELYQLNMDYQHMPFEKHLNIDPAAVNMSICQLEIDKITGQHESVFCNVSMLMALSPQVATGTPIGAVWPVLNHFCFNALMLLFFATNTK